MIQRLIICLVVIMITVILAYVHPSVAQQTSRQIVYSSSDGLFVMNVDSDEVIQLSGFDANKPVWSPDGQSIAYTSWRHGDGERDGEIYIVDIANGETIRLTDNSDNDFFPVWSPDSSQIVFTSERDGDSELYLINTDGSMLRRLTFRDGSEGGVSWSPDGKNLVYLSGFHGKSTVRILDVYNSFQVTRSIPIEYSANSDPPTWSPDGRQIAFSAHNNNDNYIVIANTQTGAVHELTTNTINDNSIWSPDGTRIAFVSSDWETGSKNICVINIDGTNETCLTNDIGHNFNPAWSPDGRQIAFISDRDGNQEIYLVDVNGTNLTRLTNTPFANEENIDWRPLTSTVAIKAPANANDAGLPRVTAFDVQPHEVSTGETVTITWNTSDADLVCIEAIYLTQNEPFACSLASGLNSTESTLHANTQGYLEDSWIMPPQGTIILEISEDRLAGFTVVVYSTNGYLNNTFFNHANLRVKVNPICEFERLDNASKPCPDTPVQEIPAAYQPFQYGGFMVWFDDKIFAVYEENSDLGYLHDDGWDRVETYTSDEPVPEGFQVAQRGFGWIANEYPNYGFATGPEIGYTAQIQSSYDDTTIILTLPDGNLLYLNSTYGSPPLGYRFEIVDPSTLDNTVAQPLPTVVPTNIPITPIVHCEGTLPSRIAPGMVAYVTISPPGQVRENLRVRNIPNGEQLGSMEEGTQFAVLDGPVCAKGFTWWEIETLDGSLRGWSAEGIAPDEYFIAPQ